jgi:hypothetical protein
MKINFPQGKNSVPIHMVLDHYSKYGNAMLVPNPDLLPGEADLVLVLVFDEGLQKQIEKDVAPVAPKAEEPKAEEPEEPKVEETKIPEEPPVEVPAVSIPVEQPISTEAPAAPIIKPPDGKGRRNR